MIMTNLVLIIAGLAVFFLLKRALRIYGKYSSKRYPIFFYKDLAVEDIGIPVFNYHSVAKRSVPDSITIKEFERQMRYLADNKYHTLNADEFVDHLIYGKPVPSKSVLITFDDGRASMWTAAFPILKKYSLRSVCFLVPSIMTETGIRPNEYGDSSIYSEVDLSNIPTITWDEARIMHISGLVDFQSHTLEHTLIQYSSEIVDFIHPTFRYGFRNFRVPLLRFAGEDQLHSRFRLGTPIYKHQPRMGAARRYFDDEQLRHACIAWVEDRGGEQFFAHPDWRNDLLGVVKDYRIYNQIEDRFETQEEQILALRHSLELSKKLIENHLPDHAVRHLAYPWNHFSSLSSSIARSLGYKSAFIDINSKKFPLMKNNPYLVDRLIPINEFGDDPFMITRVDARDNLVLSLPGNSRLTYHQRVITDFFEVPTWRKVKS